MVAAHGGRAILQVQEPAIRLMQSLAAVRAGLVETALLGASPAEFGKKIDLECPLMSLPAVFGTKVATVPWPGAYLGADPLLASVKRAQFPPLQPQDPSCAQYCVGICWAGNPRYKADRQRSVQLLTLLPLLRTPGITWIALQKGPAAEQLAALSR